jgi:hypothetical protein
MPEASDDPRREDLDIDTPTGRSKIDRLRTDPPRPEDAMPEIVMMSDIFDGIDLQSPGSVAARPPEAEPTGQDGASAFAITPPANPVTPSIDAPRTERQHAQQDDSTAAASHDWPAQSATTVLDGIPAPVPVGDEFAEPRRRLQVARNGLSLSTPMERPLAACRYRMASARLGSRSWLSWTALRRSALL